MPLLLILLRRILWTVIAIPLLIVVVILTFAGELGAHLYTWLLRHSPFLER